MRRGILGADSVWPNAEFLEKASAICQSLLSEVLEAKRIWAQR